MSVIIRPATEADQATITRLIRQARLNPRHLHWANFLIAEVDVDKLSACARSRLTPGHTEVAQDLVLPEYCCWHQHSA
jgi:hypothetical protein